MSGELDQIDAGRIDTAEPGRLSGQTCVVTGASRGIGRAIAVALADSGADVVVNFVSSAAAAQSVVDAIGDGPGRGCDCQADVADAEAVERMAEVVHDAYGPVDVLVNNAGITIDRRFERMSPEDWHRVIDVNLGGAFNCTRAFYEDLKAADHGRLINVSSVVGQRGNFGQSNYAASKSGLFGFTRSLALELARHETTVNCVAPGFTETDMIDAVDPDQLARIRQQIPLGRFARTEEVACLVRFLAEPAADYITGEIVNVNGGMYA